MHLSHPAPLALSPEALAQLSACLDVGCVVRADVLAAAGLDEAAWQRLRAEWLAQLAAGDGPGLAQRFSRAYARARQQPGAELVDMEDTLSDASPPVAPDADVDGTAELALPPAGPALPFRVSALLPPPQAFAQAAPDPAEMTLEVPCTSPPSHAALPFVPAVTGRRQRLVCYDTATGRPLPQPYWINEPTPQIR
jgi:hypothetical protein